MSGGGDNEGANYESGPFCRHWADPSDCDIICATCGHGCARHDFPEYESDCLVEGCHCTKWEEPA